MNTLALGGVHYTPSVSRSASMLLLCVTLRSSPSKTRTNFFLTSMSEKNVTQRLHLDTYGESSAKKCERRTLTSKPTQEHKR